tara:strand:- start:2151 stop:2720 length:570 start_codon:yes stop_codon:yes gene_type:complete
MDRKINECPADDAVEASFVAKALDNLASEEADSSLLSTRLSQYLGMLRAMHLWFHGAHNVSRGAGFGGDHVNLFGVIYLKIQEEMDAAIEKAVGVTGDEGIACPMHITNLAVQAMGNYPSPPAITSLAMASVGLEMEKNFLELVETMFYELESAGSLSLGLNDFLAQTANSHEENVYLLQQRVKTELEN